MYLSKTQLELLPFLMLRKLLPFLIISICLSKMDGTWFWWWVTGLCKIWRNKMANLSHSSSRCFSANIETNISLGNICQNNRSITEMNVEDIRMCQLKKHSFAEKKRRFKNKRLWGTFKCINLNYKSQLTIYIIKCVEYCTALCVSSCFYVIFNLKYWIYLFMVSVCAPCQTIWLIF